jgi:hypothetical protein
MMEAVRTSETSVDNHFTQQYIPEDNSEHQTIWNVILEIMKGEIPSSLCGDRRIRIVPV